VQLRGGGKTRTVALDRFYLGYQKKDLAPGEFVVAVTVPASRPDTLFASYKVSKRFDQDIAAVCAAFSVRLRNEEVVAARLAYGGMAAIAARATKAEAALVGAAWSSAAIDAAIAALAEDFKPLTDMRASSDYRLQAAGNLLRRFYLQHSRAAVPLRTFDALAERRS
jgi:xanthine dehydrogenase small subunit